MTDRPRSILWGDDDVPVLRRPWPSFRDPRGYRKTYDLRPGERWTQVPFEPNFLEYLAVLDDGPVPVGVAIPRELTASGADWAYRTELVRGCVLLDAQAVCVPNEGPVEELIDVVRPVSPALGGLPDVIGRRSDIVLLREAKRAGKDSLRPNHRVYLAAVCGSSLTVGWPDHLSGRDPLCPIWFSWREGS